MSDFLDQDIKFLPGIGPQRADILKKELKIFSFEDLLYYFPYKYIDRKKFYQVAQLKQTMSYIQLKGRIIKFETNGEGSKQRLIAHFSDESGVMELLWFQGIKWVRENIRTNTDYVVFGKPSVFSGKLNIVHPEIEPLESKPITSGVFQAFYNTSDAMKKKFMTSKVLNKFQANLSFIIQGKIKETLPPALISKLKLMALPHALRQVHFPENPNLLKTAIFRLKFEELFLIQLKILSLKHTREGSFKGFVFSQVGYNVNTFFNNHLPFELTYAQKK